MDYERLFNFCCQIRESPEDAPFYADYLEDLGENRELAFVVGSCVTMQEWMEDGPGFVLLSPIIDFSPPDREPYGRREGPVCWCNWTDHYISPAPPDRSELPGVILAYLVGGEIDEDYFAYGEILRLYGSEAKPGEEITTYRLEARALASQDLSQACLRWARDKARQVYLKWDMVC